MRMNIVLEPVSPGVIKVILEGRLDIAGAERIDLQFSAIARGEVRATPQRLSRAAQPGGESGACAVRRRHDAAHADHHDSEPALAAVSAQSARRSQNRLLLSLLP
jgi:hypothetical protein